MADDLLAKKMLSLDMKERTAIEEEIHGIQPGLFDQTSEIEAIEAKALSGLTTESNGFQQSRKQCTCAA